MKGTRQVKKQTNVERIATLEQVVVRQAMQIEGIINAITKAQESDSSSTSPKEDEVV